MRGMILAAGRGERMRDLTRDTPKPLLRIGERYLIEFPIMNMVKAGITDIVINVCYHGEKIKKTLGDGRRYGARIVYSEEEERLESGGGINKALPLLGDSPFIVMSSDIVTDFPLIKLPSKPLALAHLVLVANPSYHLTGDFGLRGEFVDMETTSTFTFANIGVYHPKLFEGCPEGHFPLNEILFTAIKANKVTGEVYRGTWYNIGTPEDLALVTSISLVI